MLRYSLIEFDQVDSTSLYARRRLRDLTHGEVICARAQTAGRGRWQRPWVSDVPGNLCVTLVLKPAAACIDRLPLAQLSQLLALSLCQVLDAYGVQATLKWPNDVQVHGCKIAGVLSETVVEGQKFLGLLIGVGVNLNLGASALAAINQPATSLAVLLGHPVEVPAVRDALLRAFFDRYDEFLVSGFGLIRSDYLARFPFIGQEVDVRWPGGHVGGRVVSVTDQGALEITTPSGEVRTVTLGEMFPSAPAPPCVG